MIKDLLTKKPFVRVQPSNAIAHTTAVGDITNVPEEPNTQSYNIIRQSDFACELYPSGHKINSPLYYPNKIKYDEANKRYFEQPVIRTAFPFQRIIMTQQLIHICGNDIHIESTNNNISE